MALRIGIRINTEYQAEVNSILGVQPTNTEFGWELWVDADTFVNVEPTEYFLSLLESNFSKLENIGIAKNDITIWIFYEYERQCNLEFLPAELNRIGDFGITLCISCWRKGSSITF